MLARALSHSIRKKSSLSLSLSSSRAALPGEAAMEANLQKMFFNLTVLLLLVAIAIQSVNADDCKYTIKIRTGSNNEAGTDSVIGLILYDQDRYTVDIPNLVSWGGKNESGHDYFERGNLDTFSGRGPCLKGPICAMSLSSDGSGTYPGWYCDYVQVKANGPHGWRSQWNFIVEQWLAVDYAPCQLTAVRDYCRYHVLAPASSKSIKPEQVTKSVSSA